jgi:hypothetical protein
MMRTLSGLPGLLGVVWLEVGWLQVGLGVLLQEGGVPVRADLEPRGGRDRQGEGVLRREIEGGAFPVAADDLPG